MLFFPDEYWMIGIYYCSALSMVFLYLTMDATITDVTIILYYPKKVSIIRYIFSYLNIVYNFGYIYMFNGNIYI